MEALMQYCRNWGEENCHYEISDYKYTKQIDDRDKTAMEPSNYSKYDEICKKCKARFFDILVRDLTKKECPVCRGIDFIEKGNFDDDKLIYLKCKSCNTNTVLIKQY